MKKKLRAAMKDALRSLAEEVVEEALEAPGGSMSRYRNTFSTLEIRFGPGSDPRALSIPYQPFGNRTDLDLSGFRLTSIDK